MKRIAFFVISALFSFSALYGSAPNTENNLSGSAKREHGTEMGSAKRSHDDSIDPRAEINFNSDFDNVPAKQWERTPMFYEVIFKKDGKDYRGFYDFDGNLIGTTTVVKFSELPMRAQQQIKEKYKDYTIGKAIYYDDYQANSTDMYLYGTPFESEDNYFIELTKGSNRIVVQATLDGDVYYFTKF